MGKKKDYKRDLEKLQIELVDTQAWAIENGLKVLILFEGRDTAGKDGVIKRITEHASLRHTRVIALSKPSERQQGQWYLQRYVPFLPSPGEMVLFNRSWYNRAGVEQVMDFCTPEQHAQFLKDAPRFERMLTDSGVIVIKLWLDITKKEQAERLEARIEDPLKRFKVSSLDAEAQTRWDAYTAARDTMLAETHTGHAPWIVIATDDKKTARLNIIRYILHTLGRPGQIADKPDKSVVFSADKAEGRLAG